MLATHLSTGETRAVKIISKARFTRTSDKNYHFESLRAEITVMQKMSHPNIIKLYEVYESATDLYLVMECCSGGELFDRIKEKGSYSEKDASVVMRQMTEGIRYMHSNGIAHCDLKVRSHTHTHTHTYTHTHTGSRQQHSNSNSYTYHSRLQHLSLPSACRCVCVHSRITFCSSARLSLHPSRLSISA